MCRITEAWTTAISFARASCHLSLVGVFRSRLKASGPSGGDLDFPPFRHATSFWLSGLSPVIFPTLFHCRSLPSAALYCSSSSSSSSFPFFSSSSSFSFSSSSLSLSLSLSHAPTFFPTLSYPTYALRPLLRNHGVQPYLSSSAFPELLAQLSEWRGEATIHQ